VARDAPVKAAELPDRLGTNARIGHGLQRLFEPVSEESFNQLDHLLMLLDRSLFDDRK
jgi:hypothetical protein